MKQPAIDLFPKDVTATEWAASPLVTPAADDERLRLVARELLHVLFDALDDAKWPDKFQYLDDRLGYFANKVRAALATSDGVRELVSAVLTDFDAAPRHRDMERVFGAEREMAAAGWIETAGMLRRELPYLVAEVGQAVRERAKERKREHEEARRAEAEADAPKDGGAA